MSTVEKAYYAETSFQHFFDHFKDQLYGFVLVIVRQPHIAEEITLDIFFRLWLCREILHGVSDPEGHIFAMARSRTLHYLQKASHDLKLLPDLHDPGVAEGSLGGAYPLVSDYDRLVQEALELLSPARRQVYQLSQESGLSYKEIAQRLHLSRFIVRNHLSKGEWFVQRYLAEHGIELP
jgi:RNA polymerase sigma factor (sigma-70 family)